LDYSETYLKIEDFNMAIDISNIPGITPLEMGKAKIVKKEPKTGLRKFGEFFAPTTTGLLTGEKPVTGRQLAGAALEIGSFAIPAGAVGRGLGLLGKGVLKLTPKATRALTPVTRTTGAIKALGVQAGGVAGTAGAAGTMYGAGRALGDEKATAKEIVGEAALTGLGAAALGGFSAPVISLASKTTRGLYRFTQRKTKVMMNVLNPQDKGTAIDNLYDAYYKGFVENNPSALNALEKITLGSRRTGGPDTAQGLIKELAQEGYIPVIEGEVARMRPVINEIASTRGEVAKVLSKFIEPVKGKTSLSKIKSLAKSRLRERTDVDLVKTERDLDRLMKTFEKRYGKSLTASQVRQIEIEAGKRSSAFKKTEKFIADAANAVSKSAEEILEASVGTQYKVMKGEMAKLFRLENVAKIINNKRADVGFLGEAMGRFLGTTGGAMAGIQVAGPGGLVIAGVLANLGSKSVAQMLRLHRFNPQIRGMIIKGLKHDDKIFQRIIKGASREDSKILKKAMQEVKKDVEIPRRRLGEIIPEISGTQRIAGERSLLPEVQPTKRILR